jgi:dienelactone hydrolase
MRLLRYILLSCFLTGVALAQSPQALPLGQVIPRVECASNTTQSYALYLPSTYKNDKKYPVVFIFEPAARGPLPLKIMREAAEKFGYILVASNNSRNGPFAPELEAATAMWRDVMTKFSIDQNRIYMAGFSGGARAAVTFATACKGCVAAVGLSGAGFPPGIEPKNAKYFAVFSAVGDQDFNFPEIVELEPKLREAGFAYGVRRFDGVHQWAPAEVWNEAFEWFDLLAMKKGSLAKDPRKIDEWYQRRMQEALQLKGYQAYRGYRQIAADFDGLVDVTATRQRAAELEKNKEVKDAQKRERQDAELQAQLTGAIWTKIDELTRNTADQQTLLRDLHALFEDLRQRADNEKDGNQRVAQRALYQEFAHASETGGHLLDSKDYRMALVMYDVIVSNAKQAPGAHLQKARALAAMGDKKKSIEELRLSVRDGLTGPANLEQPEFASLHGDPQFQSILESVPAAKE